MSGFWFLSSPYTRYAAGLDEAARIAAENTGLLRKAGISSFSPIVHGHAVARAAGIDPLGADFWMGGDKPIMEAARGLIVLMMDGWDESEGMAKEDAAFRLVRKPIKFMMPGSVPADLVS